jgi:hypothetical protein
MKTLANPTDLATLRSRIDTLTPLDARRWGSMTAAQMVCHLADSFNVPLGERMVTRPLKRPPVPRPLYKWLALNFPRKWPEGVPTPPEIDQQIAGTPPAVFAGDRVLLLMRLDAFRRHTGPWSPHPIFGAMTTPEWMRWGYLHTDHHLRQFRR